MEIDLSALKANKPAVEKTATPVRPQVVDRDVLIVRQSSLKAAVEFANTQVGPVKLEDVLRWAGEMESWVVRR